MGARESLGSKRFGVDMFADIGLINKILMVRKRSRSKQLQSFGGNYFCGWLGLKL